MKFTRVYRVQKKIIDKFTRVYRVQKKKVIYRLYRYRKNAFAVTNGEIHNYIFF